MSTPLEALHGPLFTPLATSAAAHVIGGAAASEWYATLIGHCVLDDQLVNDYAADPVTVE